MELQEYEAAAAEWAKLARESRELAVALVVALRPFARMQFDNNFSPAHYSDGVVLRFEATVGEIRAAREAHARAETAGLLT